MIWPTDLLIPIPRPEPNISYSNYERSSGSSLRGLKNDTVFKSTDVCPETYKGTLYGYPFYDTGWVPENCTYQKPVEELVTIVFDFTKYPNSMSSEIMLMVSTIDEIYPGMKITVAVQKGLVLNSKHMSKLNQLNVSMVTVPSRIKPGKVLNKVISAVATPCTYIATNVYTMDEDSRIERPSQRNIGIKCICCRISQER